jgi:hypothetical protein
MGINGHLNISSVRREHQAKQTAGQRANNSEAGRRLNQERRAEYADEARIRRSFLGTAFIKTHPVVGWKGRCHLIVELGEKSV